MNQNINIAEEPDQPTKPTRVVKESSTFKLVVSDYLENKIRQLCALSPDKEWSGVLFCKFEGSIYGNNLVIHADDMFLMDIGGSASTSFEYDERVYQYQVHNQLFKGYTRHLIHSHGRLKSFLSSVDIAALAQEAVQQEHFVSLVVNNAGEYCAAVTCVKEREAKHIDTFVDFGLNRVIEYTITERACCYYMCEIEKRVTFKPELFERFNELKDAQKAQQDKQQACIPSGVAMRPFGVAEVKQLAMDIGDAETPGEEKLYDINEMAEQFIYMCLNCDEETCPDLSIVPKDVIEALLFEYETYDDNELEDAVKSVIEGYKDIFATSILFVDQAELYNTILQCINNMPDMKFTIEMRKQLKHLIQ